MNYSGPLHKISSQSVHNFLSNVVHRQTNRQTDKLTNANKNITSFAKEVMSRQREKITAKAYAPDRQLCLVAVIKEHFEKTAQLRKYTTAVLISTTKPHSQKTRSVDG